MAGEIDDEEEMDAEADTLWLNTGRLPDPELAPELSFRAAKMPKSLRLLFLRGLGFGLKYGWVGEGKELPERVVKISCSESSSGGVSEED